MEAKLATVGTASGWVIPALVVAVGLGGSAAYWKWGATDTAPPEEIAAVDNAEPGVAPTKALAEPAATAESLTALALPETTSQEPEAQAGTEDQDQAEPDVVAEAPQTPSIDEVRLEKDGLAVVAGRAKPGSTVSLLLDGKEAATATADSRGAFAAVALLSPSDAARVLSLVETTDGEAVASDDEVILAPVVLPEPQIAAVEPAPDTEGEPIVGDTEVAALDATSDIEPALQTETTPEVTSSALSNSDEAPSEDVAQSDTPAAQGEAVAANAEGAAEVSKDASPNAVALLKSTRDGVELLQPVGPPSVMTNVAIDTISYSDAGEVLLAGRAQDKTAAVRVYLDNNVIATLPVDTQGRWRGDLPNVDSGVYTLRVDEVDGEGVVTSRVETPFKREEPGVLIAAAESQIGTVKAITVQPGNTLWAIARERYGDGTLYVRVFEANSKSIRDPDLIYPGQIFDLPD